MSEAEFGRWLQAVEQLRGGLEDGLRGQFGCVVGVSISLYPRGAEQHALLNAARANGWEARANGGAWWVEAGDAFQPHSTVVFADRLPLLPELDVPKGEPA